MTAAVVIRADASPRIGTGHVMRCLALAAAAKKQGWLVCVAGCVESDELQSRLKIMGLDFKPLEKTHPDPSDLEQTLQLLFDDTGDTKPAPWLVLDGYQFDSSYHRAVRDSGFGLLVVDDYNHLDRYDCDILLNQNIGADRLNYQTAPDSKRLLGPRFALLRPEFQAWKDKRPDIPEKARNILITMGGADPDNTTSKVLEGLALPDDREIEVKVVVGPANPRLSEIEQIVAQLPFPGEVLFGIRDMSSVMDWADLALTSASVTSLELAYMGVPMLAVVLAENQKELAAGLVENGAAINLGSSGDWTPLELNRAVSRLLDDRPGRQAMSEAGRGLVDGRGADRVLAVLCRDEFLLIREARPDDCRQLWVWANDPVARTHSFNTEAIPWEEHQAWFNGRLSDPEIVIYLAALPDDVPVGTVRFQVKADCAVISVTIDGVYRALGFGAKVIRLGCEKFRESYPHLSIQAFIKPGNPASQSAFAKAGFTLDGETDIKGTPAMIMVYSADER